MLNPVNRATMIDMAVIWMRMAEWAKPENRWPINRILKYEAFQPEHISVMGNVFEDVLRTIGLVDRQDLLAEKVAKKVIELAVDEARSLNHHYIGTEHILLGLIGEGEGIAASVLASMGVNLEQARTETIRILTGEA